MVNTKREEMISFMCDVLGYSECYFEEYSTKEIAEEIQENGLNEKFLNH